MITLSSKLTLILAFIALAIRLYYVYGALTTVACAPSSANMTEDKIYTACVDGFKYFKDDKGAATTYQIYCDGVISKSLKMVACVYIKLQKAKFWQFVVECSLIVITLFTIFASSSEILTRLVVVTTMMFYFDGSTFAPTELIIFAFVFGLFSDVVVIMIWEIMPDFLTKIWKQFDTTRLLGTHTQKRRTTLGRFSK